MTPQSFFPQIALISQMITRIDLTQIVVTSSHFFGCYAKFFSADCADLADDYAD
jgi:hypothetical protein